VCQAPFRTLSRKYKIEGLSEALAEGLSKMSGLAPLGDDVSSLDPLRAQQPHDVGDIGGLQLGEQGHAGDHAPSHDKVATVDLVGEGRGDDADRQRDHDQSNEDRD
jgi:hypothetical protein